MIYFFADNHYDTRAGFCLNEKLKKDFDIKFFEDDISALSGAQFLKDCDLLMLNLICGTGKFELPGKEIENPLKEYCKSGRPIFLVHAGSAAFWHWEWWRKNVGLRWVREDDPEGAAPSVHPVSDYFVVPVNSRHPLSGELEGFDLKNDEIYTKLQRSGSIEVLMQTTLERLTPNEATYPMAYVFKNEWGGTVFGFLPGHKPESFENAGLIHDVKTMISFALKP
jgi:type 1 glutamine amidotransferase